MHVLVITVVHHPEDARILHRQIAALRESGHAVTYAAPFAAFGAVPRPGMRAVDLPRAAGRTRRPALRAARRALAGHGAAADVVLLHDPELLLALPGALRDWARTAPGRRPAVVWDVHEDTAAALTDKPWVPGPLRRPLGLAVRVAERAAESRIHLLLAEDGYRGRFRREHPVVPNLVRVPGAPPQPPGEERVVYLGHLSRARGTDELLATARLLGPEFRVEAVGAADPAVRPELAAADRAGLLRWHGYLPNDAALGRLGGALAGLSLLHDRPNYRHSRPTKVLEYMAHGIPVVTTPSPLAADLVRAHGCGLVVPYGEPAAAAAALRRLRGDPELRRAMGARGHAAARAFHWPDAAGDFVARLESWAARRPASPVPADP
ncbi:glycosyltransferase [Streptomyces aidingensis]|uniref:D-inositol 3-phosphate glycosyltransferase n=1 Tax=Streptomyces aidingensis TaxID=910347 RepID=A0A1I1PBT1_9ACTN|nr:glycosyltransferase [Streptomyces aidingensis]SFD07297.1 Glycosyltransferase involved in cell wall bisynthesis [Streptomyces aidingensis]